MSHPIRRTMAYRGAMVCLGIAAIASAATFAAIPAAAASTAGDAHVVGNVAAYGGGEVTHPGCTDDGPRGGRLDGFAIDVLPVGVGEQVSDFTYEWEEVTFNSRVWESGPDEDGAYSVDASVKILRGDRLTDLSALLDYLAYYHERDVESWELTEFEHPDGPGYRGAGEAFWLVEPGVAVSVRVDGDRFTTADLMRTANGVRQLED